MDAGRELDALVAEKVMGLPVRRGWVRDGYYEMEMEVLDEGDEPDELLPHHEDLIANDEVVPAYSTDVIAAWQVLERWEGDIRIDSQNGAWRVELFEPSMQYSAWAETAPLAICHAALAAVAAEVPTPC